MHEMFEERKIHQFLAGGKEAVERAAKTIKNMLMFSRQSNSQKEMVDIAELVDKTIELTTTDYDFKKKYDFKFVKVVRYSVPGLPGVLCYSSEIEQVILYLFKNALQAMEDQKDSEYSPEFHLRISPDENFIRLDVEDLVNLV